MTKSTFSFCLAYVLLTVSSKKNILTQCRPCLPQDYVLDLFQALIDRQEWNDSGSVSERVLRSYLLLFSCYRNYPPCLARATRLFKEWKDSDGTMQSVTN